MKLFSQTNQKVSLEELEIERVVRRDEAAESGLTFDELYTETEDQLIQQEQSEEKEESQSAGDAAETPPPSSDEPGDRISGDSESSETDTPVNTSTQEDDSHLSDEDKDLLEHVKDETPPTEPAKSMEHMRSILARESYAVLNIETIAQENYQEYEGQGNWGDNSKTVGQSAWDFTKKAARWLGNLGIKVTTDTLPKLAQHTYKGLIYAFDRLAYSFMVGYTTLDRYLSRRVNSFNNLHQNIDKGKQVLELLSNGRANPITEADVYDNSVVIRQIVIGDSKDITANIPILTKFIGEAITSFGMSIKEDIVGIRDIIEHSKITRGNAVLSLLNPDFKINGLRQGVLPGFETENTLLTSYYVDPTLPGNVNMIVQLPSAEHKTRTAWVEAYRDSEIFLGVNRTKFKINDSIPYMDVDGLKKVLDELAHLCDLCIKHQTFYESMKKQKLEQRLVYKNYFDGLMKTEKKVSIKDSLIDLVTIKNNFIDKVYMPAAIDIHDYAVRVIVAYLKFVEKNIKVLTP